MDFEKMAQFLEIMNMFTEEQPGAPDIRAQGPGAAQPWHGFEFRDNAGPNPELEMMRMVMPYLDYNQQRTIGMMLKLTEMQRLIEMYGAQAYAGGAPADWRRRLLVAIRPHVVENRRYMIDLLLKLMEIRQILDYAQGAGSAAAAGSGGRARGYNA